MKNLLFVLTLITLFTACKKDTVSNTYQVYKTPPANSDRELIADSTFLYAREIYLWNDKLGEYNTFNPRKFLGTDELQTAQNVMDAIKAREVSDLFSYATTIEDSEQGQTGNGEDWGFFVKAGYANANDIKWFITYVYAASDAGQKGVRRGWYIEKLNGVTLGYDNASVAKLNDLLFGSATTAEITFGRLGLPDTTFTVNKTTFQANSVLFARIYTHTSGKRIGYFVFNQFFNEVSRIELVNVFDFFQNQGIDELVVDLRNNLGGSTATQDLLANLIAPYSANGKTMYYYEFNSLLQEDRFILLRNKAKFPWVQLDRGYFSKEANKLPFRKEGSINLNRVFFIVSNNSASASELLINNLKPVMDVQLIGDNTRGKSVGFFPVNLLEKVALYPVSFRTVNSEGAAVPHTGFAPNKVSPDGVQYDWGDTYEPCLYNALSYIINGSYPTTLSSNATIGRSVVGDKLVELKQIEPRPKVPGLYIENKF